MIAVFQIPYTSPQTLKENVIGIRRRKNLKMSQRRHKVFRKQNICAFWKEKVINAFMKHM